MKKNLGWTGLVLAGFILGVAGSLFAGEAVQAGVAAAVKGEVRATSDGASAAHALKSGDQVFMGDKIETGKDGQLQVLLLDQTVFTLGPSSAIKVDEFLFDPSNDDGKVKASVMKGIFHVVSGKVAHKKPENMSVDLPAGSIGFRGTNVAGIIDGQKSTVILLGPVGVGRIYVTNMVNGEVVGVDIDEAGNATIVDGPNSAPVAVFQVSEADLARIAAALGQQMTGGGDTTGMDPSQMTGSQNGGVDAADLLALLNDTDAMNQLSILDAQESAQKIEESKKEEHGSDTGGFKVITVG